MGQTRRKKACKTPPSTPKDPRETPKRTNHDGTVAPSGRPWPRTKDPKGAPKTPLGNRGGRQNSAKQKLRAPLQKTQKQKKDNKNTPQIRSPFTRVLCVCPSGGRSSPSAGLFWRRRGTKKTQKPSFHCSFGPQGVPKR